MPEEDGFSCSCPSGLAGAHCEIDTFNECHSNPCRNEGTCHDRVGEKLTPSRCFGSHHPELPISCRHTEHLKNRCEKHHLCVHLNDRWPLSSFRLFRV